MLSLNAKLKKLRISKGRSLQQVADAVDSSKSHIWQLETGKSGNPSLELLRNLADFFEVSVAYLAGETLEDDQENDTMIDMYRDLKCLCEEDREMIKRLIKVMRLIERK